METDKMQRLIDTWSKAYSVILKRKTQKIKRLDELLSWDRPLSDNGKIEHEAKIIALKNLLY